MQIYLSGLSHAVGDRYPIADLAPLLPDGALRRLTDGGIRHYRRSDLPPAHFAFRSLSMTLGSTRCQASDLDLVFYCSAELGEEQDGIDGFMKSLNDLGATHVPVIGLGLARCVNLTTAIDLASMLIKARRHQRVAVVTTDGVSFGRTRLVQADASVFSDGAASCLVSAEPADFELLGIGSWSDRRLRLQTAVSEPSMQQTAQGIGRAFCTAATAAGVRAEDIEQMFSLNLTAPLTRFLAKHCGLDKSKLFNRTTAEMGHVFSADILINMQAYLADVGNDHAGPLLALASGDSVWSAMVVRRSQAVR